MRFQKYLKRNIYPPYKYNYLDYNKMRSFIKETKFDEDKEKEFVLLLDANIDRVFGFVNSKHKELVRRLDSSSKKDKSTDSNEKIKEITEEMKNFSEFIRVNTIGFKKIISRHNKHTGFELDSDYKTMLKERVKDIKNLDELIYKASKISLKSQKTKKKKESNNSFIRKTDKYWVHKENVIPLKFQVLQNLPIYVFSKEECIESPYRSWNPDSHDTRVSSVYFDNVSFELYAERLQKTHHSEAIRIRWYGPGNPNMVFIERKKHEDGWTGETSKKLRFKIEEKYVVDYINGKDVWSNVKSLNKGEDVKTLYNEIQESIVSKQLRPIVRTYYKRSAFQLPNDSSVRISLDTELCMIKECTDNDFKNPTKTLNSWRRSDIDVEYPYLSLPKTEIVRFPHAILEVKTQSLDETKPKWIEDLINGPLVEHVHKFSKYLHGCAVLYPHIKDIPYWLPQLEVDIRKDPFCSVVPKKQFKDAILIDVPGENAPIDSDNLSPIDVDCHGIHETVMKC